MSTTQLTPFRRAWLKWKSLRNVPWRKRFLIGLDLQGNTFWEFQDQLSPGRMRRIVEYPRATHYSDVKISPQWHQWLRHTRLEAPTIQEQSLDVVRLRNLKMLAAEADMRWAAKKSLLDAPVKVNRLPLSGVGISGAGSLRPEGERGTWNAAPPKVEPLEPLEMEKEEKETANVPEIKDQDRIPRFSEVADERRREKKQKTEDPWKKARGGPSEEWQPAAADIAPARRR